MPLPQAVGLISGLTLDPRRAFCVRGMQFRACFSQLVQHGCLGRSRGPPGVLSAMVSGRSRCLGSAAAGSEPVLGDDVDTDVLIVGGGPSGLVLSALLSRLGVRSILLEQRGEPTTHPQAHFVGVRTMEILRGLGVFDAEAVDGAGRRQDGLDAAVRAASPPREHWRTFRYCTAMLGGLDLGAAQHFSAAAGGASADELTSVDVQLDAASPAGVAHLAQVSWRARHARAAHSFSNATAALPRPPVSHVLALRTAAHRCTAARGCRHGSCPF